MPSVITRCKSCKCIVSGGEGNYQENDDERLKQNDEKKKIARDGDGGAEKGTCVPEKRWIARTRATELGSERDGGGSISIGRTVR